MKAIMYHYVRPYNPNLPNLKHLHIEDFEKQLDFFEHEYGFISYEDFKESLETGKPREGVILTFDDGLSCHYDYVFPELLKRNLWGIFYIPIQPYIEKKILDVHRTHILLGQNNSDLVLKYLDKIIDESILDQNKLEEFNKLTYNVQDNDNYTLKVKRLLNYFISYNNREEVMNKLMNHFVKNEDEILSNYYIKPSHIKEMHNEKMIIGSHTVNHPVMSRISNREQKDQVEKSFNYLESIVGKFRLKTFCYPYGGFHSFTKNTENLLTSVGCEFSFNVEQRNIDSIDLETHLQSLPRYDCNQFKYGKVKEVIFK